MSRAPHGPHAGRKIRRFRPTVQALEERQLLAVTIADPGFESSLDGANNNYGFYYQPPGSAWTFDGRAGLIRDDYPYGTTPQGHQAAFLQIDATISQVVAGWTDGSYQITFAARQRDGNNQDFRVLVDGVAVATFQPNSSTYHYYTTPSFPVSTGDHTITFSGTNTATGDNTVFLDDIAARPATPGVPIVGDPSFEMVVVGAQGYTYGSSGSYWQFVSLAGLTGDESTFTDQNHTAAPDGTQVAFLQNGGSLIQTVVDWSSGTYQVSFSAAQRALINTGGQDFQVLLDDAVVATFQPTSTAYQTYTTPDFPVTAGQHVLGFRGLNTAGGDNTAFIDEVTVTPISITEQLPNSPIPKISLSANGVGTSEIDLTWTLLDDTQVQVLERNSDDLDNWSIIAVFDSATASYKDEELTDGTQYLYRLKAYRADGSVTESDPVASSTDLAAPESLRVTHNSIAEVALAWNDLSQTQNSVIIEELMPGVIGWQKIGTTSPNVQRFTVDGPFLSGGTYQFRVRAQLDGEHYSDYSGSVAVISPTVEGVGRRRIRRGFDRTG